MGLFRKEKTAATDHDDDQEDEGESATMATTRADSELNSQAQEVMKDNLDLMKEIVFRIREDPEFARNIYKDCPRLQHLLDQYPDLRPIFEDPNLIRINFEEVYRNAGGVLPEDEEKKQQQSCFERVVNSPIFKILKILLFVKKIFSCLSGGGLALITGCFMGCCFEDALEHIDVEDILEHDIYDPSKEALHQAAEYMENPHIQEHLQALMGDIDGLKDAIENDPTLKALRDSNPLCRELMNDPTNMKIITDPDNLRALGNCPELVNADFADPDWTPTDIETGGFDTFDPTTGIDPTDLADPTQYDLGDPTGGMGAGYDGFDVSNGMDPTSLTDPSQLSPGQASVMPDPTSSQQGPPSSGGGGGSFWSNSTFQQECIANSNNSAVQMGQQPRDAQRGAEGDRAPPGRFGGMVSALTNTITTHLVMNEMNNLGLAGGNGPLSMFSGGSAFDQFATQVDNVASAGGNFANTDLATAAQDTMDNVEGKSDEAVRAREAAARGVNPRNAAGGVSRSGADTADVGFAQGFGENDAAVVAPAKPTRLGKIAETGGNIAAAIKAQVVNSLFGDIGDEVLAWKDEKKTKNEDDFQDEGEGGDGGEEKRGLFSRGITNR